MKQLKKILYWVTSPISFTACVVFATLEGISYQCQEVLHHFEAWCFNYKDSGLVYRGEGIWSSPHKGDEGYE